MELRPEEIAGYCLAITAQPFEKANAIVVLTGDGYGRVTAGAQLHDQGWAPLLMITGADSMLYKDPDLKASDFARYAWETFRVPSYRLITDDLGSSTLGQARNVVAEAKKQNWKTIILVASGDHIVRAYLTFLKTFLKDGYPIRMLAHASWAPWFAEDDQLRVEIKERWGRFVKEEYPRIVRYQEKGDLATWSELEAYLREQKL